MIHKLILSPDILERGKNDLSDDGAEFAACRRDTVGCRPIACWECFPWNNKLRAMRNVP